MGRDRDHGGDHEKIEVDIIFANGRWLLICVLGGLTGGMSIHRKDQTHKLKIIPFELHRRIQTFGTLGTHYAMVVGGPAIEYRSHGQCQVTGGCHLGRMGKPGSVQT